MRSSMRWRNGIVAISNALFHAKQLCLEHITRHKMHIKIKIVKCKMEIQTDKIRRFWVFPLHFSINWIYSQIHQVTEKTEETSKKKKKRRTDVLIFKISKCTKVTSAYFDRNVEILARKKNASSIFTEWEELLGKKIVTKR